MNHLLVLSRAVSVVIFIIYSYDNDDATRASFHPTTSPEMFGEIGKFANNSVFVCLFSPEISFNRIRPAAHLLSAHGIMISPVGCCPKIWNLFGLVLLGFWFKRVPSVM